MIIHLTNILTLTPLFWVDNYGDLGFYIAFQLSF